MNAAWQGFAAELARWRDAGRTVEFWWRDDDAARPAPALSRLLALAERTSTPLALAAVPLQATRDAFEGAGALVSVLQHGTDHRNRAGAQDKKTEFPAGEAPEAALERLRSARARLAGLAPERFCPVLVPPWNRMREPLAARIAEAGFRGLTRFGPRAAREAAPGVAQVNTHVDLIAWGAGRGFAGDEAVLGAASRHLGAKREGRADAGEATGWLSHHLVHDEAAWAFLERLFETVRAAGSARWVGAQELFHIP
jgi:hypothetical protein